MKSSSWRIFAFEYAFELSAIGRKNALDGTDLEREFDILVSFQKGHGQKMSPRA